MLLTSFSSFVPAAQQCHTHRAMENDELERLRRLEGEARAIHAAKEAEKQRLRQLVAAKQEARDEARARTGQLVKRGGTSNGDGKRDARPGRERGPSRGVDLDVNTAVAIARQARGELDGKQRADGEKSILWSAGLSLIFGPVGWLYAGSWRESIPAAAAWIAAGAIASKILPMFLLMPALMVMLPISAIAGVLYAWQHNKQGTRTRLFGDSGTTDGDGSNGDRTPKKLR
jgi:hypothetical protein